MRCRRVQLRMQNSVAALNVGDLDAGETSTALAAGALGLRVSF
jgi:hypothetical protein